MYPLPWREIGSSSLGPVAVRASGLRKGLNELFEMHAFPRLQYCMFNLECTSKGRLPRSPFSS